jgi:hypothetical protein
MASCSIMLLCLTPPPIGMKPTLGRGVGVGIVVACCLRGEQRGVGTGVGSTTGARCLCTPQVIWGTLSGTLFLVTRECVCLVSLNVLFVVGLGAAIIGGASVICISGGGGGAISVAVFDPLCSTLCSDGITYGTLCRSPGVRIQWWSGLVSVCEATFCLTRVTTFVCFSGSISCIVVTSSSITSCKCLFHRRKGS